MLTGSVALALALSGGAVLWLKGRRDHREELRRRAGLLDAVLPMFPEGRLEHGADFYPSLTAPLGEGRSLRLDLVPDTLVFRRLPQLWLRLTIEERTPRRDFAIGALSRPTGAEFYSLVHGLPEWMEPPAGDLPLLARGRNVAPEVHRRAIATLGSLFTDPELKEAVLTPTAVRIVRRASEGDRASHLLLRQADFAMKVAPAAIVEKALRDAHGLAAAFDARDPVAATD